MEDILQCGDCGHFFPETEIDWDWESGEDDVEGKCPECGSFSIESFG